MQPCADIYIYNIELTFNIYVVVMMREKTAKKSLVLKVTETKRYK